MVASTVTPASAQPPPDVPPLPKSDAALPDYLRRFSLWCRNGFADKFGLQSATPHVYMTSLKGNVFMISISDSGLLLSTVIAPGTGKETKPVIASAPITTPTTVTRQRGGSAGVGSSYQMVGINLTFTSSYETQAVAIGTGLIGNAVANGETDVVVCFGTGTPPTAGTALAGTIIGGVTQFVAPTAGATSSFTATGVALPLSASGSYWFDLAAKSIGGGGTIANVSLTVSGLP